MTLTITCPSFIPHHLPLVKPTTRPSRWLCTASKSSSDDDTPEATGNEFDQFEQFAVRDKITLDEERRIAQSLPKRQRHHQVFLRPENVRLFEEAARRHVQTLHSRHSNSRLWVLKACLDPTFGTLKKSPSPPRSMLVETGESTVDEWVKALNRTGNVLSVHQSYAVEWAELGRFGEEQKVVGGKDLIACEIVNADWRYAESLRGAKKMLTDHAQEVVKNGKAKMFEVFQSVDEPSCFKTMEVYCGIGDLQDHMNGMDRTFAEEFKKFRAAVNRVRQLYEPVVCLKD